MADQHESTGLDRQESTGLDRIKPAFYELPGGERARIVRILAVELSKDEGQIRRYIRQDSAPTYRAVRAMCAALGLPAQQVLEEAGYTDGVSSLYSAYEFLEQQLLHAQAVRTSVSPFETRGSGLIVQAAVSSGDWEVTVVPQFTGGTFRKHYRDLIFLRPGRERGEMFAHANSADEKRNYAVYGPQGAGQAAGSFRYDLLPQTALGKAMAFVSAGWWDFQDPEVALAQHQAGYDTDLVINASRHVAAWSPTGQDLPMVASTIAVLSGHWCGGADIGRFLGEALNMSYSAVGLEASTVFGRLPHAYQDPHRDIYRLELARGYINGAGLQKPRIWSVDVGDRKQAEQIARLLRDHSDHHGLKDSRLKVIYLQPSPDLVEYAAQVRAGRRGTKAAEEITQMQAAGAAFMPWRDDKGDLMSLIDIRVSTPLPESAWPRRSERPRVAADDFFDLYASTAHGLLMQLGALGGSIPLSDAAIGRAGLNPRGGGRRIPVRIEIERPRYLKWKRDNDGRRDPDEG